MTSLQHFLPIQQKIEAENIQRNWAENHLLMSEIDGLLRVDFYASPFETYFDDLLTVLCEPEIANRLQTLRFHSPDEGANGTRHWSFGRLVNSDADFPALTHLSIDPYDGFGHNHPIVCDKPITYDEHGVLAKWLTKAPNLKFLAAPSAPNGDFFKREKSALEILSIQAGYDTQQFILNFAASDCFPNLRSFEYCDYDETYAKDYPQRYTPLEHFQRLFQSPAFDQMRSFVWRNPIFSSDELTQLKALRPQLALKTVRIRSEWVR